MHVSNLRFAALLTLVLLIAWATPPPASAAFFQISETCPSGLGNAFAGGAAVAENACTVWFNPAGMMRLPGTQAVIGAHSIDAELTYKEQSSTLFIGAPIVGGDGGDGGEAAIVPNVYVSHRFGDRWAFGIGVNAPFGLATDFDAGWVGRYHADKSEIQTVNVNPSFAFRAGDTLSLGIGINYQTIDAELSQAIDFGTGCLAAELGGQIPAGSCGALGLSPQRNDGHGTVKADDDAIGFNLGFLWEPNEFFRIGGAYRSGMNYDLEGDFTLTTPDPGTAMFAALSGVASTAASASVDLPETTSLSVFWQASQSWSFMADATQTGWSSLPKLAVEFANGAPDSVITLDLDDTMRYSVGGLYAPGGNWALRLGYAMDESPTPNASLRTPRLPDADRTWMTIGIDWSLGNQWSLALAYADIEIDKAQISKADVPGTEGFLRGNLSGSFDFGVKIISVGLRRGFGGGR
jgi:long-chain fatty acid transport protein